MRFSSFPISASRKEMRLRTFLASFETVLRAAKSSRASAFFGSAGGAEGPEGVPPNRRSSSLRFSILRLSRNSETPPRCSYTRPSRNS